MSKLHRNRARNARHARSILDALEYYKEVKERQKQWNKTHYSGLNFGNSYKYQHNRKKPWYIITTGKQYNYEERKEPWGQAVSYYRVQSQAKKFADKVQRKKMTNDVYRTLLIEAKIKDWLKKHPRPIPYNPSQPDLFEAEFMLPWVVEHTKARENIINFVNNIGNKVIVYARYINDIGYPRKVVEFRSDHQKLMILDGKYANHLGSKSIQKAQKIADNLGKINTKFVALKVVDGSQECILIPHQRLNVAA